MGWLVVMVVGFMFEVAGVALAARGLWQTWKQNAQGRSFWPPKVQRAIVWTCRHILRKPPRTHSASAVGTTATYGAAFGVSHHALIDTMSTEDKIQAVQRNAVKALHMAAAAKVAIDQEARNRSKVLRQLTNQIEGVERGTQTFARRLVVDGVPKAVGGLVLAAVGLGMQAVASVATF